MNTSKRYSPEVRERAVRMVLEHQGEHASQWAAIQSIAGKLGCTTETLRRWVRQTEVDVGKRAATTTDEQEQRLGLHGVIRGKPVRTTISNPAAPCPLDHVNRQFKVTRPNELWVSDFTYGSTWQGFVYVAFIIDVFARRIVDWRASSTPHTEFVLDALEQALYDRRPAAGQRLVAHSDRGSQYTSIRYTERLAEAGIEPSVGSVGDSYDNALAETINGLYKAEVIHRRRFGHQCRQRAAAVALWLHTCQRLRSSTVLWQWRHHSRHFGLECSRRTGGRRA